MSHKQYAAIKKTIFTEYEASNYELHKLIRLDDHQSQSCAYFQVHQENFSFNKYSNGSQKQRAKYQITPQILKYYKKRFFLFSRFSQGIKIDEQSWFSAIPQPVSLHLLERLQRIGVESIFQPFSGVGGIAVHLASNFKQYTVNDIDMAKIKMLRHNLTVYDKNPNCLEYHVRDFLQVDPFRVQVLLICPPWGMIDTAPYSTQPLDDIMHPKLTDILVQARRFTHNIMLQMPKNTNLLHFARVLHQIGLDPLFSVSKILTQNKLSQLFIYMGDQAFMNISNCKLYAQIYTTLAIHTQEEKKNTRKNIKVNCPLVMKKIYEKVKSIPNKKHIFFQ